MQQCNIRCLELNELRTYVAEKRINDEADTDWFEQIIYPALEKYPDLQPFFSIWIVTGEKTGAVLAEFMFKGVTDDMIIEIGYHTHEPYKNCGIMTWVIGQMKREAKRIGVKELTAYVLPENKASQRVLEKNNFTTKGLVENMKKYSYVC